MARLHGMLRCVSAYEAGSAIIKQMSVEMVEVTKLMRRENKTSAEVSASPKCEMPPSKIESTVQPIKVMAIIAAHTEKMVKKSSLLL